jgi:hypothetical protein
VGIFSARATRNIFTRLAGPRGGRAKERGREEREPRGREGYRGGSGGGEGGRRED